MPYSSPPLSSDGEDRRVRLALALFGRGVAHDLNNVTALLRGLIFLAGQPGSGSPSPALLPELEGACDRLEILGDQLLLADPVAGDEACDAVAVAREAARRLPSLADAPVDVVAEADAAWCGMGAQPLRAALLSVFTALGRALPAGAGLQVRVSTLPGEVGIVVFAPGLPSAVLQLRRPEDALAEAARPTARISAGLWMVDEAMRLCGGRFTARAAQGGGEVVLHLPAAPPGAAGVS